MNSQWDKGYLLYYKFEYRVKIISSNYNPTSNRVI